MKLTPQHRQILELHEGRDWVCSTAIEFCRDQRKRISEMNNGGYVFEAKRCDGRCGKKHSSNLFMRRLIATPNSYHRPESASDTLKWFEEEKKSRPVKTFQQQLI